MLAIFRTTKLNMVVVPVVAISLGLMVGCGRDSGLPRAAVQGVITVQEQPLEQGVIRFTPKGETKGPRVSIPVKDGEFRTPTSIGPVIGEYEVVIEATEDFPADHDNPLDLQRLAQQRANGNLQPLGREHAARRWKISTNVPGDQSPVLMEFNLQPNEAIVDG